MPRRFILTGAPGAGKTTLLRQLELDGAEVVEEAATDIITLELALGTNVPWTTSGIARLVSLQRQRELVPIAGKLRFSDRSAFCTLALARFLDVEPPSELPRELERLLQAGWYEPKVFFVELFDTIARTEVRRITHADARRFASVHASTYREFGFELVSIPPGPVAERLELIRRACDQAAG